MLPIPPNECNIADPACESRRGYPSHLSPVHAPRFLYRDSSSALPKRLLLLFLTFSALVANPKKTTLHGGQSRSWSSEQGKKEKEKVWQRTPPPPPARCSFVHLVNSWLNFTCYSCMLLLISRFPLWWKSDKKNKKQKYLRCTRY